MPNTAPKAKNYLTVIVLAERLSDSMKQKIEVYYAVGPFLRREKR
jgi:hypothetical protein